MRRASRPFDDKHVDQLDVTEAGKDADALKAAWKTLAALDVASYKGHEGRERVRISAKRGEPGYPRAAAEALSQEAGQFAVAR